MKFRKKPLEAYGFQFNGTWPEVMNELDKISEDITGTGFRIESGHRPPITMNRDVDDGPVLQIDTGHGIAIAWPGDYVVLDGDGFFYPVRQNIFEATYEVTS